MQSNHDAFISLAKKITLAHMKQHGNTWKIFDKNSKFYCSIDPEVFDNITQYGGTASYMIIYPILLKVFTDKTEVFDKIFLLPIFCVRDANNTKSFKFFDLMGRTYTDVQDFIENNHLPPGKIAFPKDFHYEMDNDANEILIEWVNIDTEEKLNEMEMKRNNNWMNLIGTAGITAASVFALTATGALPAFGVLLGATWLYGDDEKCDPLDDPILKEGADSIKLFENYEVLLPKDFTISKCSEMPDLNITRKIIIMAGHYIDLAEKEIKSEKLFNAINKEFGADKEKWQVFCGNGLCLYDIYPKTNHFINVKINDFDFIVYVPATNIPNKFDPELYKEIDEQYTIKNYTELKKNKNITFVMENIIIRLCTNNIQPKQIVHYMRDIFGGNWNCFLFTEYHSYYFTFTGYMTLNTDLNSYCLFF